MTLRAWASVQGTGPWIPPERQGLAVLGPPLGHDALVALHLQNKRAEQDRLFQRIPHVDDAAPRANYLYYGPAPHAADHGSAVAQCLASLLELEAPLTSQCAGSPTPPKVRWARPVLRQL